MRWRPVISIGVSLLLPAIMWQAGSSSRAHAQTLRLESPQSGNAPAPEVTVVTNQCGAHSFDSGAVLWRQHVGPGIPLLSENTIPLPGGGAVAVGTSNQWHFYVLTNADCFTNAAFVTFGADTPGLEALASNSPAPADIDLYLSTDPAITNLSPAAIAAAAKSLGRAAAEQILLSDATPGPYYLGVKCESQAGAEYELVACFSDTPFFSIDLNGNHLLRGFPVPAALTEQGLTAVVCFDPQPVFGRRVVVTNAVTPGPAGVLRQSLAHAGASAVLAREAAAGATATYDDSAELDLPWAQRTAGPGTLLDFAGKDGWGQWLLVVSGTNPAAAVDSLSLVIEPQQELGSGVTPLMLPGSCREEFVQVRPGTTNLSATANLLSGAGPVTMQLAALDCGPAGVLALTMDPGSSSASLFFDAASSVPLHPGTYRVRLCNEGTNAAMVTVSTVSLQDQEPVPVFEYVSAGPTAISDDTVNYAALTVTNQDLVETLNVGVRINHPRVSDLAIALSSPSGRRVLLQENRGGASPDGMGALVVSTNTARVSWTGGPEAFTNLLEVGARGGTLHLEYDFYSLPDTLRVYYGGALLFDSGLVSWSGTTNLVYGPGAATNVMLVVNEGGNHDTNTAWAFAASTTVARQLPLTFTENLDLAPLPIKFAPAPFTNLTFSVPGSPASNGIFYMPEQPLSAFAGEPALGQWKLEIKDTQAGATEPPPTLVEWRLEFTLRSSVPVPVGLSPGQSYTNLIGAGQVLWLAVDVPPWATWADNRVLFATASFDLLFNQSPQGSGAMPLLTGTTSGATTFTSNTVPPLQPGGRYYLGVRNTNTATAQFALQVDFDVNQVITLASGMPWLTTNLQGAQTVEYYQFTVSSNAARVQFEVNGPNEPIKLLARRGLPLPGPGLFDYSSANPGTNDQLIVLDANSSPVPLQPGDWYLAVLKPSPPAATYAVLATEWPVRGIDLRITGSSVANDLYRLEWQALPGVHYFVEGKTNLTDPGWTVISPTLTAGGFGAAYSVPLSTGYSFFRVCEGLVVSPAPLLRLAR